MNSLKVPLLPPLPLDTPWDSPLLAEVPVVAIANFREEGSPHRPDARVKLFRGETGIQGIFWVRDRYVVCRHESFGDPVYEDSCVEFFLSPDLSKGYFNFEFNAGGAMLAGFVTDHRRTGKGLAGFRPLDGEDAAKIGVLSSFREKTFPEIREEIVWNLSFHIPFEVLEKYAGEPKGNAWRGNFYKCADKSSNPHWVSWTPLPEKNFHLPECFGELVFSES